ncbi:VWA domain-containing protein [Haloferula sp. A504]|uniref:vWA domain-containing protein n=1 Tax=Haloferula sp. A504 TaxID=3373601 RepID=UPI0031C168B0|nr:VWA domain-containing protein [Verrucomicrobiaceae bacterium E54]
MEAFLKKIGLDFGELSFASPWVILLLCLPVMMGFWEWKRRGHPVVMPFDHGTQAVGTGYARFINTCSLLTPLLLAVAILVAAGPRRKGTPENQRRLTNIQFCLDISGSMATGQGMNYGGMGITRYEAAMRAIRNFMEFREDKRDAFGLTVFAEDCMHWVPLTRFTPAIANADTFIHPLHLPTNKRGTHAGKALLACIEEFERRDERIEATRTNPEAASRMIILVTDGQPQDLEGGAEDEVVGALRRHGVRVFVISLCEEGVNPEVEYIAHQTGGAVLPAFDEQELGKVFRRIDEMQPVEMIATVPVSIDNYGPFARIGLFLASLFVMTLFGFRYTPW